MSATASAEATFTPSQILHALMLSYLYPLFKNPHTGNVDPAMARNAAVEILKTFRIRDTWELFTCTQIMSFGLAALGSIGLSMSEGLSPAMVIRCRGNANGLHRASQQSRRMLDDYRAAAEAQRARDEARARAPIPDLADAQAEAAAQIAETKRLLATARGQPIDPTEAAAASDIATAPAETWAGRQRTDTAPAAGPNAQAGRVPQAPAAANTVPSATAAAATTRRSAPPLSPVAFSSVRPERSAITPPALSDIGDLPPMPPMTPGMTEQQHQRVWANAMLTVAQELTAELAHVSPEERRLNAIRISALTTVAGNLLKGRKPTRLPPLMVPRRSPE
jgi:hypothetical protein